MVPELVRKQLQLLKELAPNIYRVALLSNPANSAHALAISDARVAAALLGLQLQLVGVRGPADIESAFATMAAERADAVIVLVDSMLIDHRTRLAGIATRLRLPMLSATTETVAAGGLMAYGPNVRDMFRRAAFYVDKILNGANPGELPIEQPTTFELAINLRTARALGMTIPQSLMLRADEVIQ
jgi:putative ABC transport system substrate-binding protein